MKIVYSLLFAEDFKEILEYVTENLKNPRAADNLNNGISKEIARLKESPFLGESISSSLFLFEYDLRRIVYKNYIIVYRVTDVITMERIFNARRDWMAILFGTDQNR